MNQGNNAKAKEYFGKYVQKAPNAADAQKIKRLADSL